MYARYKKCVTPSTPLVTSQSIHSGMSVDDRLKQLAKACGLQNVSELARAADIREGTMRQHINRNRIPYDKAERYVGAGRGTGVTVDWLMKGTGQPPKVTERLGALLHENVIRDAHPDSHVDGREIPLLPVRRVSYGGSGHLGVVLHTTEAIDQVRRPHGLERAKEAFAYRLPDNLMSHAYRIGDTIAVDPGIPGDIDQDCLFANPLPNNGGYYVLLRYLVSATLTEWRVRQFNPVKEYSLAKADWPFAWKVHSKINR